MTRVEHGVMLRNSGVVEHMELKEFSSGLRSKALGVQQ